MISEGNKCKEKQLRERAGKMGDMATNFAAVVLVTDQPRNVTAVGDQKVEPLRFGWQPRQERRGRKVLTLDASPLSPHFGF